ncbi:ATP-grasp domain-containing protein [Desulfosediminicola flagellatus]|uniref:ATP-grasp domain-containing protein n=1 Tax=Desulfosediminicola flagellatus TaxID=2569541 RepID=UPI0010AD2899|nr:ATP-grasp domain-containing protein [Desulfosediminicola flagellatus]
MIIQTLISPETTMEMDCDDVLFSNFSYNPEAYYFLYVGDLKNYSLNCFVKECLERRLNKREVRFIAIVPDVCIQYNYTNIIVINPVATQDMIENHAISHMDTQPRMSCRLKSSIFMKAVSESKTVRNLIETILANQNQLYVNLYESMVEMTLDSIDRVSVLGPDKQIARKYNDKVFQYNLLKGRVPCIDGLCCEGREHLLQTTSTLWEKWPDGIFVSAAYSAGGANSAVTYCQEDVVRKFKDDDNCYYLVTRYIPHDLDPTVLAVVANENDVYIAGIADQVIQDGNRFVGSTFPSVANTEQQRQLREHTVTIGRILGEAGYRGIFGCDYLIDRKGDIHFLEINARKQGTTLEFCFTLEQTLPEGSPMLPELEYYAVTENRFPAHTVEMNDNHHGIHWGTHNYKITAAQLTKGYIPQNPYERETFKKIARKELIKDFVILEHLGTNFLVSPGTFLARVVSVARCAEDVAEGLCQGVGFIQQTIHEA